jgi:hypothetical protein
MFELEKKIRREWCESKMQEANEHLTGQAGQRLRKPKVTKNTQRGQERTSTNLPQRVGIRQKWLECINRRY